MDVTICVKPVLKIVLKIGYEAPLQHSISRIPELQAHSAPLFGSPISEESVSTVGDIDKNNLRFLSNLTWYLN